MKKLMITVLLFIGVSHAQARFVVGTILNETVGKIIRAIDLEVQKAQNQTIWLQNAKKAIENELHHLQLSNIAGISQQQKDLFSQYYQELFKVKVLISDYEQVAHIITRQEQL